MSKQTLYHYTDKAGKDAILKEGVIHQSHGPTDAAYGTGVYLTGLPPSEGITKIARNNWDGMDNAKEKAAYGFQVELRKSSVKNVDTKRDVSIHKGDIDLDKHSYKMTKVPRGKAK